MHVILASVLASTLSTTSLAALSTFLSSRSTCSTIFPWASMPTYRDKEIDFKIAEKYYCWKQNKSSWKNQYLSSQEGEGGGLCRSVPAPHQTGRSSNLNVSGSSCDLPVQGLRVIWNFSSTQKSRLLPPTWERLDCRHCSFLLSLVCCWGFGGAFGILLGGKLPLPAWVRFLSRVSATLSGGSLSAIDFFTRSMYLSMSTISCKKRR